MSLQPGTQVGRFRVVRMIAQGGMAEVYHAEQELTGGIVRPVAVKVIRPEYAEARDFREMFLDEARTACTLTHPNIVHIYEVGNADGLLYMAMELVVGESLIQVVRRLRDKKLRLADAALLAVGIYTCSALEAVHSVTLPGQGHLKLVHRDVSPHNLLLGPSGSLKLIDFGIAKAATNRSLTSPGITKGKVGYFSPEQAMGKVLDGRSDLFSLGITLYKAAAGIAPLDEHKTHLGRTRALMAGEWPPLQEVLPDVLPGFAEAVAKALKIAPEERFQSALEMREALEEVAQAEGLHVGQSALARYVDPPGEEAPSVRRQTEKLIPRAELQAVPLTATSAADTRPFRKSDPERRLTPGSGGKSKVRSEPVPLASPRAPSALDEAPTDAAGRHRNTPMWIAAGLAFTATVVLGILILRARTVSPETEATPAHVTAEPALAPSPEEAPPPAPHAVAPAIQSTAPRPAERARRARPMALTAAAPKPPAAEEETIPEGQGVLRVGAVPDAEVKVGGKVYGTTPLNLPLRSGRYIVQLSRPGKEGDKVYEVKLLPDRTVRLKYYFAEDRWLVE